MEQAKADYATARNTLMTAFMKKDVAGIKAAFVDRKRAMAARVTLAHQAKAAKVLQAKAAKVLQAKAKK